MDCTNPGNSELLDLPPFPSDPPFTRHTDSVLCCSVDSTGVYAITGGVDDKAYLWDVKSRVVKFECSGHTESVIACGFSLNSTQVATADMNGYIQVRNTTTGTRIFEFDLDEITWILWHNQSDNVLLAGTIKGDLWMWNIANTISTKTFQSYGFSSTAARLLLDGCKLVVAYGNGSVRLLDLKTSEPLWHVEGRNDEITSVDISSNGTLIIAGCTDCTTKLISVVSGKQVAVLQCAIPKSEANTANKEQLKQEEEGDESNDTDCNDCDIDNDDYNDNEGEDKEDIEVYVAKDEELDPEELQESDEEGADEDEVGEDFDKDFEDSVESVAFSHCGNYISTANLSGCISIWDISTQVIRHRVLLGVGITRTFWDDQNRLICACLDGSLRLFNYNLEELNKLHEHQDQILDCHSKRNIMITASEDKTCRIYSLNEL